MGYVVPTQSALPCDNRQHAVAGARKTPGVQWPWQEVDRDFFLDVGWKSCICSVVVGCGPLSIARYAAQLFRLSSTVVHQVGLGCR